MAKMNKKIKTEWLKNLRSGKFAQGQQRLADRDDAGQKCFCCLGVLCETMGVGYHGESHFPSRQTLKKAGVSRRQAEELASRNDDGESFTDLARYISRNL